MFFTYILQSQKSGRFYIGHTQDVNERLQRHNSDMVKATRNKGPWIVVFSEIFQTRLEANKRELHIKSMKSRLYIKRLIEDIT